MLNLSEQILDADETDAVPEMESVAIIGMSCRFPGADSIEQFWDNLVAGKESISCFQDSDLLSAGVNQALLVNPNYVKAGGTISGVEYFDANFFGFSPREAELTDPQQRIFLECAWQALEDAGYADSQSGLIGVFASGSNSSYYENNLLPRYKLGVLSADALQLTIGNDKDYLATRVSYKLDLRGPSMTVQTACSSSLVSVSLAAQYLLNYQCDLALCGGVTIRVPHEVGYISENGSILSPDGHSRTFDEHAQGTVPGNGCGVIVLKRLSEALRDRDHIYAVIKGSAVNNDGSQKVGFSAPTVHAQSKVISLALANADTTSDSIRFVECHGTGTVIGDSIELEALIKAFENNDGNKVPCVIGSVKSNLGHLECAAGIAGLIKASLAIKHKKIPPTLNVSIPNRKLDTANDLFRISRQLDDLQTNSTPIRAGISSFGMGGTNAHVVLEQAPATVCNWEQTRDVLLLLSAQTETALSLMCKRLAQYLRDNENVNLSNVSYTLIHGRRHYSFRRTIVCSTVEEAINALEDTSQNAYTSRVLLGRECEQSKKRVELEAVGARWSRNESVDLRSMQLDGCRIPLPTYPFDRRKFWVEPLTNDNSLEGINREIKCTSTQRVTPILDKIDCSGGKASGTNTLPAIDSMIDSICQAPDYLLICQSLNIYKLAEVSINRLAATYVLNAIKTLGWRSESNEEFCFDNLMAKTGILPQYSQLMKRLVDSLLQQGLWVCNSSGLFAQAKVQLPAINDQIAQLRLDFPELAIEIGLIQRCGDQLDKVLSGGLNPLSLIFPESDFLESRRIYADTIQGRVTNVLAQKVLMAALRHRSSAEQKLNILEVGGGTGGTTNYLLPIIDNAKIASYVFTDISPVFVEEASRQFIQYPFFSATYLDLEKPPITQHLKEREFDIVVGANVVHATKDLRVALRHMQRLMAPGGLLILLEGTASSLWLDLTYGLTNGWWRFKDFDLRPNYPLLSATSWKKLLTDEGSTDVGVICPDKYTRGVLCGQSILLAKYPLNHTDEYKRTQQVSIQSNDQLVAHVCPPHKQNHLTRNNDAERIIAEIWKELLGVDAAGYDDDFLSLGGDSLVAVRLIARINERFGIRIKLDAFFEAPTISTLTRLIREEQTAKQPHAIFLPKALEKGAF